MASFGAIAWSSIGKKVITGITGLALFGFVCVHLLGNFTLLIGPHAFNEYAHFLESAVHGWLIYAFEVYIITVFLFHIVAAVAVAWTDKRKAREQGYKYAKDAGGKSRKSLASKSMIYTGAILLVFVIGHIFLFKFNGGNPHTLTADGHKDLYRVVDEVFASLGFVIFTVVAMILLGLHLRHGFWSAFQSLGWTNDRYLPLLENLSRVVAVVIAVGFIILPIYMYLTQPGGH
ncbi:MAG: succinate dehydrogenase cytochrome b subunit [Candidatus Krumholzibacteriia bacterium]